jgi:EF hand domain-containing protein
MNRNLRRDRNAFLLFLAMVPVLLLAALPMTTAALQRSSHLAQAGAGGTAARSYPLFEQLDRNRDGFLSKAEAASLPGLPARFAADDSNGDGRLDKVEYARALAGLDPGRARQ